MARSRFNETIQIGLIDECKLYRAGVTQALSGIDGLKLVAQGASLGDIRHAVDGRRLDIVLLNVKAPRRDSSTIAICCSICPGSKVVVLAASASEAEVKAARKAGAAGFISKTVTGSELVAALRSIAKDDRIVAMQRSSADFDPGRLTPREQEILNEVARGQSNKEIARVLTISEKTVKQHVTRMLQKLKVRNRVEAAMLERNSGRLESDAQS